MTTLYNTEAPSKSFLKSGLAQIVLGVSILFCCAQISIPIQPIPITFQTVGIMLIGLCYTRARAVKTVLSYLTLGLIGIPVFANFCSGPAVLLGPKGGYLIGFLLAVTAMSYARERIFKETWLTMLCNCALGHAAIYLCGVSWLSFFVGAAQAVQLGFVPFILPGCIKAIILSFGVRSIKRATR